MNRRKGSEASGSIDIESSKIFENNPSDAMMLDDVF